MTQNREETVSSETKETKEESEKEKKAEEEEEEKKDHDDLEDALKDITPVIDAIAKETQGKQI